ncbi:MAG: alpha-galactosidase [Eubacteriales bacterium]|nr:alpha-galactosidase [Eubacteriales bacterium]
MAILFDEKQGIFKLDTDRTTYLIGLTQEGYVGHLYYGKKLTHPCGGYLLRTQEPPFTPSVYKREKAAFLDSFPAEYPTGGIGDYRKSCLDIRNVGGQRGAELHYVSHTITKGKPALKGLPASFGTEQEVETLSLVCEDSVLSLRVVLLYSVFAAEDVITRSARIENGGQETLTVEKAYSACLDMDNRGFEMMTLTGGWARERQIQRNKVQYGTQLVSTIRGKSSHQEHPFLALVTPETTQENGEAYAMHFVYSGNFKALAELSQFDMVRMAMGINEEDFAWKLEPGAQFQTPEAVLVYSAQGLGQMTRSFHDFYRNHMIRSKYLHELRPVLINNWEATYFDFDTDKLLELARAAKETGIEMLVMDDGWFGHRNNDDSSLGDWTVNEEKLRGGLPHLVEEVKKLGLKFGIWFEPEMISPDSDLYRAHPDWALQIGGREATQSRQQYVLDLSREEVREHAYESVARILRSAPIDYVKWDMNRELSDIGSAAWPADQQSELFHRYVLGVYEIQERLVTEFPDLLLENCSGGGARFDPGMLYYSPQIWCSDDNDAIERLRIQEGTALCYPLSTMGAHIADSPYGMTGRETSMATRAAVALAGTFGYEMDITEIPEEERAQIPGQVALYHKYHMLMAEGDYYRVHSWDDREPYDCYLVVAKDKSEALVTFVQVLGRPNQHSRIIRLKGLEADAAYAVERVALTPGEVQQKEEADAAKANGQSAADTVEESGQTVAEAAGTAASGSGVVTTVRNSVLYGDELMQCGLLVTNEPGDFAARLYHLVRQ